MENPLYQVHDYWTYPNRFELVQGWWDGHAKAIPFSETAVPRLAVIITENGEPISFLAASMDNSIGKATLEFGVNKPGISLKQARIGLSFAEEALTETMKPQYGLLQTFTSEGIARYLENRGWSRVENVVHLIKVVE